MTQNTQTTAVWVESVLETELNLIPLMVGVDADSADIGGMDAAARIIAVRIDRLTAERDAARAEVERLRPAAEVGEALERQRLAFQAYDADANRSTALWEEYAAAKRAVRTAAARARAAKEEG